MKRTLIALVALLLFAASADAQKIRFRRMTEAAKDTLTYHTVLLGEGVYCTDSKKFYIWGTDSAFTIVGPDTVNTYISVPYHILPPLYGVGQLSNGTVGGNDSVLYVYRFDIREPFTVGKIACLVSTVTGSGNGYIGLGIYDTSGAKLTGAVAGASVLNNGMIVDVDDDTLTAGSYYFAFGQLTTSTYVMNMQRYTVSLPFWSGTSTGNVTNVHPLSIATNRMTSLAMPATLGTLIHVTSFTMPYVMLIYSGATYD
jgi:hypothetical protein